MMNWLPVLGGVGGIIAALGAVIVVGRGVFRQVAAVDNLTEAVRELTAELHQTRDLVNSHETRLSILEDRSRNR